MIEWFPRKITVDRGEWPSVLSTLHCWIDVLAAASTGQPTDPAAPCRCSLRGPRRFAWSVVKGRLVPVKSAAGLLDRPLDLWWRA